MGREQFATVLEKNDLTSRGTPNTIMADSFPACGRLSCRPVCFGITQDTESFCLSQHHYQHRDSNAITAKKRNGIANDEGMAKLKYHTSKTRHHGPWSFGFCASFVIRHSYFVIFRGPLPRS